MRLIIFTPRPNVGTEAVPRIVYYLVPGIRHGIEFAVRLGWSASDMPAEMRLKSRPRLNAARYVVRH